MSKPVHFSLRLPCFLSIIPLHNDCFEMPSFTTLPFEIRREIYSYLLLGDTIPSASRSRILRPNYATTLFCVNRQISTESLDYFYTQNAFILVQWETQFCMEFSMLRQLCSLVPCLPEQPPPSHLVAGRFPLTLGLNYTRSYPGYRSSKVTSFIMSSRELHLFVKVLNAFHFRLMDGECFNSFALSLEFHPKDPPAEESLTLKNRIIDNLSQLRTPETAPDDDFFMFELDVVGGLDDDRAEIMQEQLYEVLSGENLIQLGRDVLKEGREQFQSGDLPRVEKTWMVYRYIRHCLIRVFRQIPARTMKPAETQLWNLSQFEHNVDIVQMCVRRDNLESAIDRLCKAIKTLFSEDQPDQPDQPAQPAQRAPVSIEEFSIMAANALTAGGCLGSVQDVYLLVKSDQRYHVDGEFGDASPLDRLEWLIDQLSWDVPAKPPTETKSPPKRGSPAKKAKIEQGG